MCAFSRFGLAGRGGKVRRRPPAASRDQRRPPPVRRRQRPPTPPPRPLRRTSRRRYRSRFFHRKIGRSEDRNKRELGAALFRQLRRSVRIRKAQRSCRNGKAPCLPSDLPIFL